MGLQCHLYKSGSDMRPSKGQLEVMAFNGTAELPYSAASHYLTSADEIFPHL